MNRQLTWSMKLDGKRLQLDYTVTNHTKTSIQLVDRLLWQREANPDVIIVRDDMSPHTIAFTRAFVETDEKMLETPYPTVRVLDPGASVEGRAFAPRPPTAWHNFSRVEALKPGATHAVLEIGYIDAPGSKLEPIQLPSGVVYTASGFDQQKLLRGDPKPLPK